jgi:hypothetical protein
VNKLFVLGVALFIGGIAFALAGERTAPQRDSSEGSLEGQSVSRIMTRTVMPAARHVWGAVGTIVTAAGVDERAPRTDAEWDAVATSAATLSEAGRVLMGRRQSEKQWTRFGQALVDGGQAAFKAAKARIADDLLASGETIYRACEGCHERYMQ